MLFASKPMPSKARQPEDDEKLQEKSSFSPKPISLELQPKGWK